jgi:hypothetical protein
MFKPTGKSSRLNLFSSTHTILTGKSLMTYEDKSSWHNQFREQVTQRIDEDLFRPLFCEDFGAPNASIRVLIGMMILKEAQGWSDSQLFEQCQFNLLVRSALGFFNIDDSIPAPSTYYLLRRRIVSREKEGYGNLIEKVFAQVTTSQAIEFQINGNKIRMDSKLIGSNIAWYNRYELVHQTLRIAYKCIKSRIDHLLPASDIELLEGIANESGDKVSYRSNRHELEAKLARLGSIIYTIISQIDDNSLESLQTLRRVFNDQYEVVDDAVSARPKQEISASSVQSPHDTDCHYRQKDDQQVKGYSINVTETCDTGDTLNLVTNVAVDTATSADCGFLLPAIEATQEVVSQKIVTINADGAYHSVENQEYCKNNEIDLVVSAIQGRPSGYDLSIGEDGKLIVTDVQSNTVIPSRIVESRNEDAQPKWAIRNENNQNRYFTQKDVDTCLLRKQIAGRTMEELNLRNNVEATIFQLAYHYSNAKSRYRGIIKHRMWANLRCLWINFVRIAKFVARSGSNYMHKLKYQLIDSCFCAKKSGNLSIFSLLLLFRMKYVETIFIVAPAGKSCHTLQKNRLVMSSRKNDLM